MREALQRSDERLFRRVGQNESENEAFAKNWRRRGEEQRGGGKRGTEATGSSERPKNRFDDDVENGCAGSSRESPREELICDEAKKREADHNEMFVDVLIVGRTMQEEIRWEFMEVSDVCLTEQQRTLQMGHTCEELGPGRVASGERAEVDKVQKFGVYEYDMRGVATNDELDESVSAKWLRINMGTPTDADVGCRLVTLELVYSQRMDELIVGTPSFMVVKLISHHRAKGRRRQGKYIMVLDV